MERDDRLCLMAATILAGRLTHAPVRGATIAKETPLLEDCVATAIVLEAGVLEAVAAAAPEPEIRK